jgi:hypothetical protein
LVSVRQRADVSVKKHIYVAHNNEYATIAFKISLNQASLVLLGADALQFEGQVNCGGIDHGK